MDRTLIYNPLGKPLYVMSKPVGSLCNLDCHYCYYLDKAALYHGASGMKMSEQLLERFTRDYIEAQPIPNVLFNWHGGEALLRGIDFFRSAIRYQKQYGEGREIANTIQTNGMLLNEEWCRFFKDNNFLVGISIDGPEHCHDIYRKDRGGRGTFSRVMRAIEMLHQYKVEFNTLSVVNDYTAQYPVEIYRFFKQIGSHYMQFTPVVERVGDREDGLSLLSANDSHTQELAPWSVSAMDYGYFLTQMFDEWVRQDVGTHYVQMFDATLAGVLGQPPGVCIYAPSCGHAMAMEYNGDVYSCDHFVFPENKLGNIKDKTLVEMALSAKQSGFGAAKFNLLPSVCRSCDYLSLCNGECPKNRISKSADGESGLNYLCRGLQHYYRHVAPYMEFMAVEWRAQRPAANVMQWITPTAVNS